MSLRKKKSYLDKSAGNDGMPEVSCGVLAGEEKAVCFKKESEKFFVFSLFRSLICFGCCFVAGAVCLFGGAVRRFYFGEGNVFVYNGGLAVHFLDVGQGGCAVIQLPDGKIAVVDGGTDLYGRRIADYLEKRIVGRGGQIDFLIATHAHSDHVGGLAYIMNEFDIRVVYRPYNLSVSSAEPVDTGGEVLASGAIVESGAYEGFVTAAYELAEDVRFIESGICITDGEFYEMFFHTPTAEMLARFGSDSGDFDEVSPIITLRFGQTVFVLTGDAGARSDAGARAEQWFVQTETALAVDFKNLEVILQVGHHGSDTSSKEAFLEFIQPDLAVISCGAGNRYGFPHERVIKRLEEHVGENGIYETDSVGNIAVRVQGNGTRVFLGFDNPPDLALLWICVFAGIAFFSFFNYSALGRGFRKNKGFKGAEGGNGRENAGV